MMTWTTRMRKVFLLLISLGPFISHFSLVLWCGVVPCLVVFVFSFLALPRVVPCPVVLCRVVLCPVVLCRVVSCCVVSCRVVSRLAMSFLAHPYPCPSLPLSHLVCVYVCAFIYIFFGPYFFAWSFRVRDFLILLFSKIGIPFCGAILCHSFRRKWRSR